MTLDDLEKKSAALDKLRMRWFHRVMPGIQTRLGDAHAHAERAITATLKATPEGRPTARKAASSPSFQAANARIDELLEWLAGPSVDSLQGSIRDAREDFYREAFKLHKPLIPPAFLVSSTPEPTAENIRLFRGALIHGYDLRHELSGPFDTAKRQLAASVNQAGNRAASGSIETDILDTWQRQAFSSIRAAVLRCLTDSVEFADTEASRDLINPEYLEDE